MTRLAAVAKAIIINLTISAIGLFVVSAIIWWRLLGATEYPVLGLLLGAFCLWGCISVIVDAAKAGIKAWRRAGGGK